MFKKTRKIYKNHQNRWNFPGCPASLKTAALKLLPGTGRMAAIALQLCLLLCRLTIGGAELLSRGRHTKATVHRTLLRICRHSQPSWTLSLLSDADALPRDVGPLRYRLLSSRCAACFRLVSVNLAPLSIRAISWVRSESSIRRTSVCVRPRFSVFSIRKCWSPNAAI
jgi:hypothetical protein